mmetsp:Transcript_55945/g.111171  ORF Transcript_55945/g.111171 Transcript_55945/m.111171 type:complete len:325 (+) Transcript_55945:1009-1983(+)
MKAFAFFLPVLAHAMEEGEVGSVLYGNDASSCQGRSVLQTKAVSMTREQVTECTTVVTPLDLVFLVDSSGSIEQNNAQGHNRSKQFVKDVTNDLPVGDGATDTRVAVVQFSSQLKQTTEIELTDGISKPAIEEAVEDMPFHNLDTWIGKGINYTTADTFKHSRPDAAKMLIVIADGNSKDTQQGADDARDSGIDLVAVGVGDGIHEEEMQKIAGPDGKILSGKDYAHLGTILANTTEIVCDEVSTPKPTPAPPPRANSCADANTRADASTDTRADPGADTTTHPSADTAARRHFNNLCQKHFPHQTDVVRTAVRREPNFQIRKI